MKGRDIIILEELQKQSPEQLQNNHRDIEQTRLLECESVYWINVNDDIENTFKTIWYVFTLKLSPKRESFTM